MSQVVTARLVRHDLEQSIAKQGLGIRLELTPGKKAEEVCIEFLSTETIAGRRSTVMLEFLSMYVIVTRCRRSSLEMQYSNISSHSSSEVKNSDSWNGKILELVVSDLFGDAGEVR